MEKPESGFIGMYGSGIALAIKEFRAYVKSEPKRLKKLKELRNSRNYQKIDEHRRVQSYYESAKKYLFRKGWLEAELIDFGLSGVISIDYIRKKATEGLRLDKKIKKELRLI